MGKIIRLGLILLLLTAATGLILGVVYGITKGPIEKTQMRQKMEALSATLPGASDFKAIPLQDSNSTITEISEGHNGGEIIGYNFTVTPKGYAGPIEVVIGIAKSGTVTGVHILRHAETPGLGAKAEEPAFIGQFKNKPAKRFAVVKVPATTPENIEAISGATITSEAVTLGVNEAVKYFNDYLSGGQVQ